MKIKRTTTILFFLSLNFFSQQTDKELLLNFWGPLQVLAKTDQGILKEDTWRQKKITRYNVKGKPFAALPSTDSPNVTCLSGDCKNGYGIAKYNPTDVVYKGAFKNGYPNEQGIIINAKKDSVFTSHYEGILSGEQAFKLHNDSIRSFLFLEYQLGDLAKTSNFYMPEFKMYYKGIIDNFKPYKKGRLMGSGMDLEVGFSDDGQVRYAYGKIRISKEQYYQGKAYYRDNNFYPAERGEIIDEKNGFRIYLTFQSYGKPNLTQVSIWKGDTVYVGPVDKDFLPHGKRGYLRLKREGGYPKTLKQGVWEHGKFKGKYGLGEGVTTQQAIAFRKNQKESYHQKFIALAKEKFNLNNFMKRTLYEGKAPSNRFTIKTNGMSEQFIGIMIFNLATQDQQVCVKPRFRGG